MGSDIEDILRPGSVPNLALVVDDERVNVLVARAMLTKLGFDVITSYSAKDAISKYSSLPAPLIFMDIQMPEIDGPQAALSIREIARGSSLLQPYIVAYTASDYVLTPRDPFDAKLAKPVDFEKVGYCLQPYYALFAEQGSAVSTLPAQLA